jgi:catechol 2,3-dioxygenase-like lactoylglutathione lyase family enzyme
VSRIALVTVVVPSYAEGIAFYRDVVGLTLVDDTALDDGKRWVVVAPDADSTGLLLAPAVDDAQRAAIGNQTGGRVAFFLRVEDFRESYDRMVAAGVEFLESPRDEAYGTVAQWRDPWGNRWDLLGPPPT